MSDLSAPSVQELDTNIISQLEGSLSQTVPLFPIAFTRVLAKVLAGVFILVFKYAAFSRLQTLVRYASWKEMTVLGQKIRPLVELGKLFGVGEPELATQAQLNLTVTVLNQTGFLEANKQVIRPETGVIYLTLAATPLDAPTKTVEVRASSDQDGNGGAGAIGNLNPGDSVQFVNPIPAIAQEAVVLEQTVTGADGESEDAYRLRVEARVAQQPQGGAYADYKLWGEEPPGILQVWPYTGARPGEMDIYIEATTASSGNDDGIPTSAQRKEVLDSIEANDNGLPDRRPGNAAINTFPISRAAYDATITGLTAPDIPSAETAINEAVDDYLRSRAPFIVGLTVGSRADRITQGGVAGIADEAVSSLSGTFSTLILTQNGVPTNADTLGNGQKAKLGVITFA